MKKEKYKQILILIIGPVLFLLCVYLLPDSIFSTVQSRAAIGTVTWMVFWWLTSPVGYAVTALLPISVNALVPMVEMDIVISNYSSETIMLLLGASIITVSWEESGLDKRIAAGFLKMVGDNLRNQLIFWFLLSTILSTLLPNSVVIATVTPIAVAMLRYIGEGDIKNSRIGSKLLLYIAYGAGIGGLASPLGGAMNLVTVDYLEQLTGQEYMYISWVIRFLPVMIVLVIFSIFFMVRNVEKNSKIGGSKEYFLKEYSKIPRISPEEKWSLIIFSLATILSFTREIYQDVLPGFKPAYVFMSGAIVTFFVTKKDGKQLMEWKSVEKKIVWEMIFIFAGGLALGSLINHTGAANDIARIVANMELEVGFVIIFIIITATLLLSDVTSNTATAAVAIPIVISIVEGIGENPIPFIYIASIGVNLSYMFPTSIRAVPVGYGVSPRYMFKEGWKITVIVIILMSSLSYLMYKYWPAFSTV